MKTGFQEAKQSLISILESLVPENDKGEFAGRITDTVDAFIDSIKDAAIQEQATEFSEKLQRLEGQRDQAIKQKMETESNVESIKEGYAKEFAAFKEKLVSECNEQLQEAEDRVKAVESEKDELIQGLNEEAEAKHKADREVIVNTIDEFLQEQVTEIVENHLAESSNSSIPCEVSSIGRKVVDLVMQELGEKAAESLSETVDHNKNSMIATLQSQLKDAEIRNTTLSTENRILRKKNVVSETSKIDPSKNIEETVQPNSEVVSEGQKTVSTGSDRACSFLREAFEDSEGKEESTDHDASDITERLQERREQLRNSTVGKGIVMEAVKINREPTEEVSLIKEDRQETKQEKIVPGTNGATRKEVSRLCRN